jgi:hypothetical protein
MLEQNTFDKAVQDLAIRYAPNPIAKIGDVVTVQSDWKHPHKVRITRMASEISSIDLSFARRKELGLTGWLIVQHEYIGRRLKANGEIAEQSHDGFVLSEFTTSDGKKYESIPSGFNHVGLVFDIKEQGL